MAITRRARRWLIILAILAGLIASAVIAIGWLLQPERLTALVLERAGTALDLELTVATPGDYALRPEPRLLLNGLVARRPGDPTALLQVRRAELSLPWDTLLGRNEELTITRIELDAPDVDLVALRRWLDARPPREEPLQIPTLTNGLRIAEGRLRTETWSLAGANLALPDLAPGQPLTVDLGGRFLQDELTLPFAGELTLSQPESGANAQLTLSGRMEQDQTVTPFKLDLAGRLDYAEALALENAHVGLEGEGPLPALQAHGRLAYGTEQALELDGELARWPEDWPRLPEPLASADTPLPFVLRYTGPSDLSAPMTLQVRHAQAQLDTRFALRDLLRWAGTDFADPLPPLTGTLSAPELTIEGVKLEGVRIEISDDGAPESAPGPQP